MPVPVKKQRTKIQKARRWTEQDDDVLTENHATMSDVEIGELLGRTKRSVNSRRKKLGLPQRTKRTEKKDVDQMAQRNAEARALGMSYGKYMALLHEQEMNNKRDKYDRRKSNPHS